MIRDAWKGSAAGIRGVRPSGISSSNDNILLKPTLAPYLQCTNLRSNNSGPFTKPCTGSTLKIHQEKVAAIQNFPEGIFFY